jgi:hypothetical protein
VDHNKQAQALVLIENLANQVRFFAEKCIVDPSERVWRFVKEADEFVGNSIGDRDAHSDATYAHTLRIERTNGVVNHLLFTAKDRRDFAGVAYEIAKDRYGAGSAAAAAGAFILLTKGRKAFEEFLADLAHHEEANS